MLSLGVSSDALDSSPNMSYSEGCKVRFETMISHEVSGEHRTGCIVKD